MQKRSISIQFNPLSASYRNYPYGITLNTILNQDLKTMLGNIKDKHFSSGLILGKGYNNSIVADETELSFNTIDVLEIEYV